MAILTKLLDWRKIDPEKHFKYSPELFRKGNSVTLTFTVIDPDTGKECWLKHQTPANMTLPFGVKRTTSMKVIGGTKENPETKLETKLRCAFGLNVRFDPTSNKWIGPEEHLAYRDWLERCQNCHIKHLHKNSKAFFKGKEKSLETIEDNFYKSFYMSDKCLEGKYGPSYTGSLVYGDDEFGTVFYMRVVNEDGSLSSKKVKYEDFACPGEEYEGMRNFEVRATLMAKTVWFSGICSAGVTDKVQQMLIYETNEINESGCEMGLESEPAVGEKRTHEEAFEEKKPKLERTGTEELPETKDV